MLRSRDGVSLRKSSARPLRYTISALLGWGYAVFVSLVPCTSIDALTLSVTLRTVCIVSFSHDLKSNLAGAVAFGVAAGFGE